MPDSFPAINPDYPYEVLPLTDHIIETTVGQGKKMRRALYTGTPRLVWKLQFGYVTAADYVTLFNFFVDQNWNETAFSWTCLNDGETYTVKLVKDSFSFQWVRFGFWQGRLRLETCAD